jgi:hypothetical protein
MEVAPETPTRAGLVALELGVGLLVGLVPLGLWKGTLGRDSTSLGTSLVGLVLAPATLILLWRFCSRYHWLVASTLLPELLRVGALITVGYFALRAALTLSPKVYVASSLQSQFALAVLVLLPSLGSSALLPLTSKWLLARVVPVLLLAASVPVMARSPRPATKVLFIFGVLGLMGLPGTPLFPAYLAGILALPQGGLSIAILVFMAGSGIGALRLILHQEEELAPAPLNETVFIALGLALLALALGFSPALLDAYLT